MARFSRLDLTRGLVISQEDETKVVQVSQEL